MNVRRAFAISRRIVSQFRRDHRTLALMFVAPIVVLGLLGWVIRDQTPDPTRFAVIVNDRGLQQLGIIVRATAQNAGLDQVEVADEDAARRALREDRLDVAVVIAGAGQTADQPTIRLITPGLSPAEDGAHVAALQAALAEAVAGGRVPAIERESIFGSEDADTLDAFAPGLVGFFAYFLVFILTGVSFLRERVGGTLERLLATPVRRSEIVSGYSLGFAFFATLQVTLITAFALGSLEIPAIGPLPAFSIGLGIANAGSPLLVFLVTVLLALGAVNLGIFISTFARTEFQILQFIPIVIVPQGLLCGLFWPVSSLPDVLEPVARALPLTYAVEGLREILVKGSDLASATLRLDLVVLAAIVVVLTVLASLTIRREVA